MITTALETVVYRVLTPKWGHAPTSGAGASLHGGRANRPGIDALYVSLDLPTALAEYQQIDPLLPPGLMVSYRLKVNSVIDFRGGFTRRWPPIWQDFYSDWRKLYFNDAIEPPSWVIGDQVLASGAKGILFASSITGGTNLVLYSQALTAQDTLQAYDPHGALPKNQDSWT
jgi:RES domain-containing protein